MRLRDGADRGVKTCFTPAGYILRATTAKTEVATPVIDCICPGYQNELRAPLVGQLLIYGTRNRKSKEFSMASTIKSVAHLSRDLGMTEETLIREGIMEYIRSRIKAGMRDRLEIMSRYQVPSLDEFEKRVQDGSIPEHPGWEDLITLENIETRVDKLKMELSHVGDISIT